MQSVTKTVSSIIVGIAITRGDFKASLDTPLLKYFDVAKVKNVDERKQRITLRHVLTMSTGLDWKEDGVPASTSFLAMARPRGPRRSQERLQCDGSERRLGTVRD
jgi:CubicO group peptidase (beta-lactamase class C family)